MPDYFDTSIVLPSIFEKSTYDTQCLAEALEKVHEERCYNLVIVPPNGDSGFHDHETAQEIWYVIEGEGDICTGEEVRAMRPGSLIYSPPKTKHKLLNRSTTNDLKCLLILCPHGDEKYILDNLHKYHKEID